MKFNYKIYRILIFISISIIFSGMFFPIVSGKKDIFIVDFNYFGSVPLEIMIAITIVISVFFLIRKKYLWLLSSTLCTLFLVLSIFFMKVQWNGALKSKFYLDFFKCASTGWYLMIVGSAILLFSVLKFIPSKKTSPYIFILPMVVGVVFLTFFPALFAVFVSFHRWNIIVSDKPFIGFNNYVKIAKDEYFWKSLWISFKYALAVIPAKLIISYIFALLIFAIPKFKSVFRVIYFLPTVTSTVAVSVIWNWIYHPYFGLANYFLNLLGISSVDWLGNPDIAIWSVAFVSVWRGLGYNIIIFLAGLNNIPQQVVESSKIDGTNRWTRLKYIITPLMKPSLVLIFITSTISAIQVFSEIYMMTGGAADTKTAVYYIWEYGFSRLRMGYASAMSLVFFGIILIITIIQMKVTNLFKED